MPKSRQSHFFHRPFRHTCHVAACAYKWFLPDKNIGNIPTAKKKAKSLFFGIAFTSCHVVHNAPLSCHKEDISLWAN